VADALGEVERGLHAQVLSRLDIDVPAIRVWGDEYRRIGRFESDYHTLAGTVRVMRTVYRKTERNGDTLDPVSVRAGGVADGWLPHTARAMAYLLAQVTAGPGRTRLGGASTARGTKHSTDPRAASRRSASPPANSTPFRAHEVGHAGRVVRVHHQTRTTVSGRHVSAPKRAGSVRMLL